MKEGAHVLSKRRKRSVEEYEEIISGIEKGSKRYIHNDIVCESIDERVRLVWSVLSPSN